MKKGKNPNVWLAMSMFLLMMVPAVAAGRTIYVDDDGPADFNNIQAAIDDANDGDTILVADGTYTGSGNRDIDFKGKAITVRSENGPQNCILSGGDHVVRFHSGETLTSVLSGFTIRHGDPGGGICCWDSSPTILNNIIVDNWSEYGEGAVLLHNSSAIVSGNIITGNEVYGLCAGIVCCHGSSATIVNNTIVGNGSPSHGNNAGVHCANEGSATITNCIFWDNGEYDLYGCTATYSCLEHEHPGIGNIYSNPLFFDPGHWQGEGWYTWVVGDYHLRPGSPCIDAGDNSAVPPLVVTDLDGHFRLADDPNAPDTGNGTRPIVDIGAYEQGINQGFLLSTSSVTVPEGQRATFTVAIAMEPSATVEVTVYRESGDPDIAVETGVTLVFDSSNYSEPQTVTLAASEDSDYLNGVAHICVAAPGFGTVWVTTTEDDNEPVPAILYVDSRAAGSNLGRSWADAYPNLQDALDVAATYPEVEEVHVAQGIYTPTESHGDRRVAFQLINSVAIKGGYAGFGEPDPDLRDVDAYETILSGDLNGDDGPDFANNSENSYHVVIGSDTDASAVLDGFVVTGGNADKWLTGYERGGGIWCTNGNVTITNCTITGNWAEHEGGGICCLHSSPTITNCTISGNSTGAFSRGGGMYNYESSPTLVNCTFRGNSADSYGGGIYNYFSIPMLTNCMFDRNSARYGGGMHNGRYSNSVLTDCSFIENSAAKWGGGMYNSGSNAPMLRNCSFIGNQAENGGGVCNHGYDNYRSSPTLTNCIFRRNSADLGGGIYNRDNTMAVLTNCTFSGNSANDGGGMYSYAHYTYYNTRPILTNCSFSGNSATNHGGGMYNDNALTRVTNCILWGNTAEEMYNVGTKLPLVSYSDIGSWSGGPGNIDADPLFLNPSSGDLRLLPDSPCIDAGDNTAVPADATDLDGDGDTTERIPFDLDGNPRIRGPAVDMGAYEYQGSRTIYVDADAPGANNGSSWADAYRYLQDALTAAYSGDEIRVAQGIYKPDEDSTHPNGTGSRTATFQLINGVAIRGGYAGFGEPDADERDIEVYETILSGDLDGNDVDVNNPADLTGEPTRAENSYHVVIGSETDANAVLDGFTISGGNAEGANYGGGVYNNNGSPTISNCVFIENSAGREGGGMYNNSESHPTVTNCTFILNAAYSGGGMRNRDYGKPTLTNCTFIRNLSLEYSGGGVEGGYGRIISCTFTGNSAKKYGGGLADCGGLISDCTISGNSAGINGGGFSYGQANAGTLINCTISDNTSGNEGGGIYFRPLTVPPPVGALGDPPYPSYPKIVITNCTVSGNVTGGDGGGLFTRFGISFLTNCVFWGNSDGGGMDRSAQIYGSLVFADYCCIQGWTVAHGGIGNIDVDPCFVEPGHWDANGVWVGGDYHLKSEGWRWDANRKVWTWDDVTSPCIDAGNPGCALGDELLSVPDDPNNEWGENLRINMGAYGGTEEASMGLPGWALLADLTNDRRVDFVDLAAFVNYWLETGECIPSDLNRSQAVDFVDFAIFAQQRRENNYILLEIYSDGWGNLLETATMKEEGQITILVYEEEPYNYPPAMYYVYASRDGYYTEIYYCEASGSPPNNFITVDVDLDPIVSGKFNGVIFMTQSFFSDRYLPNTDVTVKEGETVVTEFQTDQQGRFAAEIEPGNYDFEFISDWQEYHLEPVSIGGEYQDFFFPANIVVLKPNIYLYPEETIELDVDIVFPSGGRITTSIPDYNDGWHITVEPNGTIDGQFEYLFYESLQPDYGQYAAGWVVIREQLEGFFRNNMGQTGFNQREIDDFIEYWIPILTEYPYYAIYPQYRGELEEMIKLEFSAQPESLIRLIYSVRGLEDNNLNIQEPVIPPFTRDGFTVTEWGVILK